MTRRFLILLLLAVVIGIPLFSVTSSVITKSEQTTAVAATLSPTEQIIQDLWAQVRILQAVLMELLRMRGLSPSTVVTTGTSVTTANPNANCSVLITRYLFVGSRDETTGFEVTKLQQFLTRQGVYNGPVTGYFGPLTETGLKQFQIKNNIVISGTAATTGFGATWPKTRDQINRLNCGGQLPAGTTPAPSYGVTDTAAGGGGAAGASPTGQAPVTTQSVNTDVCPNLSGTQSTVPSGYTLSGGNCIVPPAGTPTPTEVDVCPNLSGTQTSVPSGYTLNSSGNCVVPPPPPTTPPPSNNSDALAHLTSPGSGWTSFRLPSNNKIIYVSKTDGRDTCNGTSPTPYSATNLLNCPKQTLNATKNLLALGSPGWILLKKGDSWPTESLGVDTFTSGTASEPRVIGSYGSSSQRPILNAVNMHAGTRNHVAFVGLHIKRQADNNYQGIRWVGSGTNILVEDCYVEKGIIFQTPSGGSLSNIKIRRNVIVDHFIPGGSNTHDGIFATTINGLTIEENVLDRNGYDNANFQTVGSDLVIPYNAYIQRGSTNVVVRGNISMRSAANGIQMRSGGVLDDNLFIDNAMGITFGGGATNNQITRNVVLAGKDIVRSGASTLYRGWGIEVRDIAASQNIDVSNNIVAFNKSNWTSSLSEGPIGIDLVGVDSGGLNNVTVENNVVYRWARPLKLTLSTPPAGNINVKGNTFYQSQPGGRQLIELVAPSLAALNSKVSLLNNNYFDTSSIGSWFKITAGGAAVSANTAQAWANATKENSFSISQPQLNSPETIEDYARSIGAGSTLADFAAEARKQSKDNWRRDYTAAEANDYFRNAFRLTGTPAAVDLSPVTTMEETVEPVITDNTNTNTNTSGSTNPVASWAFESIANCLGECPSLVDGKYGQAADFNGSTSGIDGGSASSIDNLSAMTVSAWVKPRRSVAETFGGRIADKRDQGGWAFFTASGERVRFHFDYSTTNLAVSSPAGSVPTGEWTHVAAVWDGGSGTGSVTLYINGNAVNGESAQAGVGTRRADGASKLMIGECSSGECSFDGAIDNLAIYNRALSAGDISNTMGSSLSNLGRNLWLANVFSAIINLINSIFGK